MPSSNFFQTSIILYVIVFFTATGLSNIVPALPLYAKDLGANNLMIGGLISGFGLARAVTNIPSGMLADRINQKILMQIGLFVVIISSIAAAIVNSYYLLLFCRIIEGVGSSFFMVSALTVLNSISPPNKRGQTMSYFTAAILIGVIFGPSLGGIVIPLFGKSSPFLLYALMAFIGLTITTLFINIQHHSTNEGRTFGLEVLNNRSIILISLATFAFAFSWTGLELTVIPIFAYELLNLTPLDLGIAIGIAAASNLCCTILAGRLTDSLGRKRPIAISLLLTGIVSLLISLSSSVSSFTLLMAFFGFASGFWGQTQAWVADLAPKKQLGSVLGYNRTMGDMGFVVGPLVLGYLSSMDDQVIVSSLPFYFNTAILVIVSILLIFAKDSMRKTIKKTTNDSCE